MSGDGARRPPFASDDPSSHAPAAFRPFTYLHFAKMEMGGSKYPLCLSGVPTVQPLTQDEIVRCATTMDLEPSLSAWRAAIGARYGVPAAHAWPTQGSSGAVHLALAALLVHERVRPVVAIEDPAYGVFETCATLCGSEIVRITRPEAQGWAVDLDAVDAAFARGAAVFCVTDLHNPTGAALSAAELAALDEIAARHGTWVLVDEVYRDAMPGPVGTSYRPGSRIVAVSSFTKCYGLGPMRAGWIFAAPEVIARAESVEEAICGVPPAPWLAAVAACVPKADALLAAGRALAATARPVMDAWVAATPHVSWTPPSAGITGLLRIDGLLDSTQFARLLRAELGVQVVPGASFGAEGTIRVSFGMPTKELRAALDVLALGIPPLRG